MNRSTRYIFTAFMAVLIIGFFLFGGAGVTAYAAQNALPGDALWSVKTGVENTRLALSQDAANRARLNLEIAERRLDEISKLIADGRFDNLSLAVDEFQTRIQAAIAELQTVAAGKPDEAQSLAADVATALTRYANALMSMSSAAPEPARLEIQRALMAAEQKSFDQSMDDQMDDQDEITGVVEDMGADFVVVSGQRLALTAESEIKGTFQVGDTVKVHVFTAADGTLTVREIEPAETAIDNENENDNQNEGLNENENENDDLNENLNENENENLNENENENENEDLNENQNGNANDDNQNVNEDDQNGNDNQNGGNANEDNGNGGHNDNGGGSNDNGGNHNDNGGNGNGDD